MSNEEALVLIREEEKKLVRSYVTSSAKPCLLPTIISILFLNPDFYMSGLILEWAFVPIAAILAIRNVSLLNKQKQNRAKYLWRQISGKEKLERGSSPSTRRLIFEITELYKNDVSGEILPLVQAVRLLDAYQRQQERLQVVEHRLVQLQVLHKTMHNKLEKLRSYGEDAPEIEHKLPQIERDEAALGNIAAQIEASCARLEAIFTGVQHAHQVRQLKRELGELSQVAGSATGSDLELEGDAFDIERQIGREIETFIRLERETDEHLRDV